MSTYLVAFVVSDFKCVSDKYNSIDINVYSRPDQIENTKYALDITIKILKFYENLYRIPYSLPKLDLVNNLFIYSFFFFFFFFFEMLMY